MQSRHRQNQHELKTKQRQNKNKAKTKQSMKELKTKQRRSKDEANMKQRQSERYGNTANDSVMKIKYTVSTDQGKRLEITRSKNMETNIKSYLKI